MRDHKNSGHLVAVVLPNHEKEVRHVAVSDRSFRNFFAGPEKEKGQSANSDPF